MYLKVTFPCIFCDTNNNFNTVTAKFSFSPGMINTTYLLSPHIQKLDHFSPVEEVRIANTSDLTACPELPGALEDSKWRWRWSWLR